MCAIIGFNRLISNKLDKATIFSISIVSAFIWIKDYKENRYMLALFLPATLIFSTFPIRQAVAHSFVFWAFHFLNKKRWLLYFLMIICMYSIHASSVITVFLCSVLFLIGRKVISWKISIPIYVIITLAADIFSSHFFDLFSNLLPYISFESAFAGFLYIPYSYVPGPLIQILFYLMFLCCIFQGNTVCFETYVLRRSLFSSFSFFPSFFY